MSRFSCALLLLALSLVEGLAACSSEPTATTTSSSTPTPPPVEEIARLPMKKPTPVHVPPKPAPPPQDDEPAAIHLPAFTFRTMDHKEAKVELGGQPQSTTPCLWSISSKPLGGETFNLEGWPPAGARFIATTKLPDDPDSKADLYVIDKPDELQKLKIVRPGECLLAWRGMIGKVAIQGALRLRVENYRFTDFAPLDNPEGDNASKFLRTLWFERMNNR